MKRYLAALMAFGIIFLAACGGAPSAKVPQTQADVKSITPEEAKARLDSGSPVLFIDTGSPEEYGKAHIEGAVSLPADTIGDAAQAELPVKDAGIIVYGEKSADAAKTLAKLGYTNVSDLGGRSGWTYGVVSGAWEKKLGTWSSFRAFTTDGAAADESIFSGYKLTMINVWATFCSPCLNEMPDLGKLSAEYASKGVRVIGVVADVLDRDGSVSQSQVELARELILKTGAEYTHLLPTADILSAGVSQVSSVPTTFFVDGSGKPVGESYVGSRSAGDWQSIIDGLLAGQGA